MTNHVIIVDDERSARLKIRQLIDQFPNWQVSGEFESGDAFLGQLPKLAQEVVLLDINMPGLNGIDVLSTLNQQRFQGAVIFATAHSEHALAAFDEAAADYLLKPISTSRLQLALERAEQRLQINQTGQVPYELTSEVGNRMRNVPVDDIDAIVISHGALEAHCGAKIYPLNKTLNELEIQLPSHFLRVHRGAIINRLRLTEAERWLDGRLLLRFIHSELEVLTSRSGARQLKRHLNM